MSDLSYMNEAGEILTSMYKWNWLKRQPASLSLVADQEYILLPVDCQTIISIIASDTSISPIKPTPSNMERILRLRQNASSSQPYEWVSSYRGDTPVPCLELGPIPTASEADAWSLFYRGGWRTLLKEDDSLPFPHGTAIRALYTEILMAVKQGYEEHDVAGKSVRIAAVQSGPLYRNAVRQDRSMQTSRGQLGGRQFDASDVDSTYLDRLGTVTGP